MYTVGMYVDDEQVGMVEPEVDTLGLNVIYTGNGLHC